MGFHDSTYVFVRVLKLSTYVALLEFAEGAFESLPSMELVAYIRPPLLALVNGVAVTNIQTMSKERERIIPFQISHLTAPPRSVLNNLFIILFN